MSRYRSSSTSVGATTNISLSWYRSGNSTVWTPNVSTSSVGYAEVLDRSMTDEVIPGYSRRSSRGEVFFNGMSSLQYRDEVSTSSSTAEDRGTGSGTHYRFERKGLCTQSLFYPPLNTTMNNNTEFLDIDTKAAVSAAILNAHANVSVSSAGILETYAEREETLALIRRLVTGRVFSDLAAYRRIICKKMRRGYTAEGLRKALDACGSEWLGYRYGIRPLVHDIHNLFEALSVAKPLRSTARSYNILTDAKTTTSDVSIQIGYSPYPCYIPLRQKYTKTCTVSVRAGILYDVEEEAANNLALRLGAQSILATAWELVPYSFVVDWFINVGTYLAAYSPSIGCTKLGSWVTVSSTSQLDLTAYPTAYTYNNWYCGGGVFHRRRTRVRKVRTPNPSVPTLPPVNVRMDMSKWMDLAALFRQLRA